jgi:hypothetical protein
MHADQAMPLKAGSSHFGWLFQSSVEDTYTTAPPPQVAIPGDRVLCGLSGPMSHGIRLRCRSLQYLHATWHVKLATPGTLLNDLSGIPRCGIPSTLIRYSAGLGLEVTVTKTSVAHGVLS